MSRVPVRKVFRIALLAFVGLWLLYVIGINIALQTHAIAKAINEKALPSAQLNYESAWSFWPGDLRVKHFFLRVDDPAVRMEIHADDVVTNVNLFALATKHFHANWVRARGASVRFRHQPALDEWHGKTEGWYPVIEPNVVRNMFGPSKPPPEAAHLFWVELERVHVEDVREVWIGPLRYEGTATVDGRLRVLPTRLIDTGPNYVQLHSGRVSAGEHALFPTLHGLVELAIPPTGLGHSQLAGPGHSMNVHAQIDAKTDLSLLQTLTSVELPESGGWLHVDAWLEKGKLVSPTRLHWSVPRLQGSAKELSARASVSVRAEVNEKSLTSAKFDVRGVHLAKERTVLATAPRLEVSWWADSVALGSPTPLQSLTIDLPAARLPELTALAKLLPQSESLHLLGGSADAAVYFAFADFRMNGPHLPGRGAIRFTTEQLRVGYSGVPVAADVELVTRVSGLELPELKGRLHGTHLALTNVRVDGENEKDWWAHLQLPAADFGGKPPRFTGEIDLEMKSVRPIVALFAKAEKLPAWTEGLLSVPDVKATGALHLDKDGVLLDAFHLTAKHTELFARFKALEGEQNGALLIRFHGFELGVGLEKSKPKLVLLRPTEWYRSLYATGSSR